MSPLAWWRRVASSPSTAPWAPAGAADCPSTPAAAGATGAYGTGLAWKLRPHLDLCRWLLGRDKALPEVTLRASPAAILADWGDGQGAEIVLGAAAAGTGVAGLRVEGDGGHVCLSADRSAVEVEVALPGVGARSFLRPVLAGCGTALEIGGLLAAVRCGTALPATPAAEAAREFETLETVAKALRRIRVPDGASS